MKPSIIVLTLLLVNSAALAQGEPGIYKSSLGIGGEFSVPVGDLANVAGLGYGGFGKYQYGIDSKTALTISAGYTVWTEETLGLNSSIETKAFRFLVGGKFYLVQDFFASIEAGTDAYSYSYTGNVIGVTGTDWAFMIPVGLGFQRSGFEVSGKFYVIDFDFPSFSITAGYNWILG